MMTTMPVMLDVAPYPFRSLRQVSARAAALESTVARWLATDGGGRRGRLQRLCGGPVTWALLGASAGRTFDPYPAVAMVRAGNVRVPVLASGAAIRGLAQRLLGGPEELGAPRPLGAVEHAVWALALATALEEAGAPLEVWPVVVDEGARPAGITLDLELRIAGVVAEVRAIVPRELALATPPALSPPAWTARVSRELAVVVARAAVPRAALAAVGRGDVITVERPASGGIELVLERGVVELAVAAGARAGQVTGYGRRDMALPDDTHAELTVTLGTTALTLRQLAGLTVGEIVALRRPLAGPFELRVDGQLIGEGELIDVEGELGVRVTALR
jgi:flagellar motor switch/type III secretory pathway protein FliN